MELQAARYTISYPSVSRVSSNVFYVHAKNTLWCHRSNKVRVPFKIMSVDYGYKYLGTFSIAC